MLSKLQGYALVALGAIVAFVAFYFKARQDGIAAVQAEQTAARLSAVKDRKEIDDEVAKLPADQRDAALSKWMRDAQR